MSEKQNKRAYRLFSGWRLTWFLATLLLANFTIILGINDIDKKETILYLIRSTAKLSFLLFMSSFVASALFYHVKNRFTAWLLTNRRYIGVSFAISHYIHLIALLLMTFHIDFNVFEDRGVFRTIIGVVAYSLITLMTLTSFDHTRNIFGKKNWKRIHTTGGYLLWVIFAKSYLLEMTTPVRIVFAISAVVVLLLRVSLLLSRK